MEEKVFLRNEFSHSIVLNKVNQNLISWDYSEIIGEGFFKHYTGHFAYIKIKISKSEDEFSHQFENNLSFNEMPFINEIIKSLNFFIAYLRGLKGKNTNLKIEIIDGTYYRVDSRPKDFQIVIFYAICDCFNKSLRTISDQDFEIIKNCKLENKIQNF